MFDFKNLKSLINSNTKAIMPTHMWGNSEDIDKVLEISKKNNLYVIEDCCLALGARFKNRHVGSFGKVGIFSFGCVKPVQGGEEELL